jgi:hypothetical protein
MTSVDKKTLFVRRNYDATTEHLAKTEYAFYEILARSNNFNQFRDLMMESLANRPSVEQLNDNAGTGRKYVKDTPADDIFGYGPHQEEEIHDLMVKEEKFDDNLSSIPYFDNIETVTKSFPRRFQRPHMYLNEDGTYTSETEFALKYPLKKSVSQSSKQPDLFEGLQIHSQLKGGKMKNTRKNRKPRK